jgi:hypothetical protein
MTKYRVKIAKHILRRNAHHSNAIAAQKGVSLMIDFRLITAIVRLTINFYRQTRCVAEEVDDIGPGNLLAAELQAIGPGTKNLPHQHFGKAHLSP